MSDCWDGIPADAFVGILLRIPPSPRRRLRLVCRHWRHVIDERTPPVPRARAKVLVFFSEGERHPAAYVFDDLTQGRSRELNLRGSGVGSGDMCMIGTCNGLLCFLRPEHGDIYVTNPAICETIAVDPPPTRYRRDESTYSFGYHPETGQYKIVHLPCSGLEQDPEIDAVHVFTLGDGSWAWREVPAPTGSSCLLRFGLVGINSVMYWWAAKDGARIMSFDLKDERVVSVELPPMPISEDIVSRLTDVSGRLGLVVGSLRDQFGCKTQVWVLEDGGEAERAWVKKFEVRFEGRLYPLQEIALPHVAHGEHVLTTGRSRTDCHVITTLEAQQTREVRKMRPCRLAWASSPRLETAVGLYICWRNLRTFAYVETREPVLVYDKPRRVRDYYDDWEEILNMLAGLET